MTTEKIDISEPSNIINKGVAEAINPLASAQHDSLPSPDDGPVADVRSGFAMHSSKISEKLRNDLHAAAPIGLKILEPLRYKRVVEGRDESLVWRSTSSLETKPGNKAFFGDYFNGEVPPDIHGDEIIKWSPAKTKAIIDGFPGSVSLYFLENGLLDATTQKPVPSVNYDDERRWFIRWHSFVSESILVGTMEDDYDIEDAEWREMTMYFYDTDTRTLRRIELPDQVVSKESQAYVIIDISEKAILFQAGNGEGMMTVYLLK